MNETDVQSPPQCYEEVWEAPGYWHSHRCFRKAKRQVNAGSRLLWLCEQHAKAQERHNEIWGRS